MVSLSKNLRRLFVVCLVFLMIPSASFLSLLTGVDRGISAYLFLQMKENLSVFNLCSLLGLFLLMLRYLARVLEFWWNLGKSRLDFAVVEGLKVYTYSLLFEVAPA